MFSRRETLALIGAATASVGAAAAAPAPPLRVSKVTLLGSGGGPVLGGERNMCANVITVGEAAYVVDCGYGAARGLKAAKVPLESVRSIFITHNHADHLLDLGPLLFFCWLQGRTLPMDVYGPPPIAETTRLLLAANAPALNSYKDDMSMAAMPAVRTHELFDAATVMQDENLAVTCTTVIHPPVTPALAYRFQLPDRSIVFSGDTAPSANLIRLAAGADILIHEATDVAATLALVNSGARRGSGQGGAAGENPHGFDEQRFTEHVLKAHTSAEDAGRVAAAAGVKLLVLNHLSPGSSALVPDQVWIAQAEKHFAGQIVVGHDGLTL